MKLTLQSWWRRLSRSTFLRYNALAFVGSVAVAALNYLYYPVLGRVMTAADFGEVQAINSLFVQVVIFLGVFNFVVVSVIAKYDDQGTQNRLITELEKVATLISLVVTFGLLVSSLHLAAFFRLSSVYPLLVLLFALVLSVPAAFRTAYLQGKRDFAGAAKTGAISAAAKLSLALLFVLLGWRAFGAILGMVLAQVLALLYASRLIRGHGWVRPPGFRRASLPDLKLIRPELMFAGLVFATTFSFNFFLSLDILAVKHWFDPDTAGLYGGIETLSRIVYFINASVAGVLLATIKPGPQTAANRRLLGRSLGLTAALGLSVLAVFLVVPRQVVEILMGSKFLVYTSLLPRLGLFTFLASVINLLVNYYLARRRIFIGPAAFIGLAGGLVALGIHHATPTAVVDSLIAGAVWTLVVIAALRLLAAQRAQSILQKNLPNSA